MDNNAFSLMFKGYNHEGFSKITGMSVDFLKRQASTNPAWRHKRWWPILFIGYLAGVLPEKEEIIGRPKEINMSTQNKMRVINHIENFLGGVIQ